MISNAPLWETMKRKNITKYSLIEHYKISRAMIQRLRNNEPITTTTLNMLCKILDCRVEDIIEYVKDEPDNG